MLKFNHQYGQIKRAEQPADCLSARSEVDPLNDSGLAEKASADGVRQSAESDPAGALLRQVRGVIFDLDGTLVESSLNFVQIRQQLGCPHGEDILAFVDAMACQHARAAAHRQIQSHELADAAQANWLPGAERLVKQLLARSLPQAIVTRNFNQAAQLKVSRNAIPIAKIITREDAPPKPDPTGLLQIAREWQLAAANILYVGDFLYDIQAARRAGMIACLYAPGGEPDYAAQADIVCYDFAHLAAAFTD